jgi:hypothetical protein
MKQTYEFIEQDIRLYRDGLDVVVEVEGRQLRFSTVRPDYRTRSQADQFRRAIQLLETDIFYDPEAKRPEMVGASSVP